MAFSAKNVQDCTNEPAPRYRCYTSYDANYSNNAMLLSREWAIYKWRWFIEVAGCFWDQNGGFEVEWLNQDWGQHKHPICLSYDGLFLHKEIDG